MNSERQHLRDLCLLIVDCPHSTPVWTETGVIVIRNQNIRHGRLDLSNPSYTDEKHFQIRTKRATPTSGDLIFTREAPMGEICMVPEGLRCCVGQRQVLLRPDKSKVDSHYLLYAFQSSDVREQVLWNEGTGSTVSNVRIPVLEKLFIPSPPLPEQRAIARVLASLDDKIELNRRTNATLEALAQTLFRAWFVDFEPVKAKAAGVLPASMDAATAALFPSKLEASTLGMIPKGWEVSEFPNEIDFLEGPGLRNWQYTESGMKFLNIRCINDGDLDVSRATSISEEEFAQKYSHFALREDDIVISTSGTLGRSAIVRKEHLPVMLNTSIIRMRGKDAIQMSYVWGFLRSEYFLEEMFAAASGSVQLNFGPVHLRKIKMLRPPDNILHAFEQIVHPLLRLTLDNRGQSQTLAQLRDALLPRLISGRLRVPEAMRAIEENA